MMNLTKKIDIRNLVLLALLIPLSFTSCSKKEGCQDPNALNFDAEAEKSGTCNYTKVIFYAPSNRIGGTADLVEKIEVFRGPTPNEELIGTITTFDHPTPTSCTVPVGAFEYELISGDANTLFLTRYYYTNGTNEAGESYERKANNSTECHIIQLTL